MPGPVPPDPVPGPVPPDPVSRGARPAGSGLAAGSAAPGVGGRTAAGGLLQSAWRTTDDGRTIFRLMPPLVLWWVWVAFAVANVADLAIQSHDWFAVQVTVIIAVVTGLMYACTLRPKVISDAVGLTIRNPFRDYRVPWGGVAGVFLGDSVEIQCQRPAPREGKTVYSWALYSPRRSRARAELRVGYGSRKFRDRHDDRARRRYEVPPGTTFGRMPAKAKELSSQHPSHVMAAELARRCDQARNAGAADGVVAGQWAWAPIAAVLIPVAALIVVIVAR
jgi:hypothetical protein